MFFFQIPLTAIFLLTFVMMLAAEWIIRRVVR
jgi:hypothetical protein